MKNLLLLTMSFVMAGTCRADFFSFRPQPVYANKFFYSDQENAQINQMLLQIMKQFQTKSYVYKIHPDELFTSNTSSIKFIRGQDGALQVQALTTAGLETRSLDPKFDPLIKQLFSETESESDLGVFGVEGGMVMARGQQTIAYNIPPLSSIVVNCETSAYSDGSGETLCSAISNMLDFRSLTNVVVRTDGESEIQITSAPWSDDELYVSPQQIKAVEIQEMENQSEMIAKSYGKPGRYE